MRQKMILAGGVALAVFGMLGSGHISSGRNSSIGFLFVMAGAAPSLARVVQLLGWKRGGGALLGLGAFALLFEYVAVATGYPYGSFAYSGALGPKLGGLVPWCVPGAWIPIVLMGSALGARLSRTFWSFLALSVGTLLFIDAVVDPVAAALSFWTWAHAGTYYGIPAVNFIGWAFSGTIGVLIWRAFVGKRMEILADPLLMVSALGTIAFFSGVAISLRQYIPAAIGTALVVVSSFFFERSTSNR